MVEEEGMAVLDAGVGVGSKTGLGGDKRMLCFVGGEEELGTWLSSVRYLCGLRRTLGGRGVWELELTVAPLRRRVKWIFWLWFLRAAALVTALFWSWFWL